MNQIQGFALSLQQKRVWSLQQENQVYLTQCAVSIEGDLHISRLQDAWRKIVARHDILRARYSRVAGMKFAIQVIAAQPDFYWETFDLSATNEDEQSTSIEQIFSRAHTVDWTTKPPLHLTLMKLRANHHLLVVTLPALCADGQSLNILFEEMCYWYGEDRATPDDNVLPYVQFSGWQDSLMDDKDGQIGLAYWLEQKPQTTAFPLLPQAELSLDGVQFDPVWLTQKIPAHITTQVSLLAAEWNVSVSILLMACWRALLWQFTRSPEMVIGYVSEGRYYEELDTAVGLFAKWCLAPISFSGSQSLYELASQITAHLDETAEWEEYFHWDLGMPDNGSPYPVVGFEFEEWPEAQTVTGATFFIASKRVCTDRFQFKLVAVSHEAKLHLQWGYDTRLFSPASVQRMAGQFEALLAAAVLHPHLAIGDLDTLSPLEAEELAAMNATTTNYARENTIHQLFSRQAARTPDSVALQYEASGLTYAQLHAQSNQLAYHLYSLGVKSETPVAIFLPRSINLVIGLLGILKAGSAYVPIDTSYPLERIRFILSDAQCSVLVTCRELIEQHQLTAERCRLIALDDDWPLMAQHPENEPEIEIHLHSQNLAYIIYTSGSTGKPKGTLITHQGVVNYLSWCVDAYNIPKGTGSLLHTSIGFDLTITSLFAPLLAGQKVILLPETDDMAALSEAIQTTGNLSLVKLTPSHLDVLNQLLPSSVASQAINTLVIGGEALSEARLKFWRTYAPNTQLVNEYGPTETVVGSSMYRVPADVPLSGEIPMGKPIANTQIYLLDHRLHLVPFGVPGELYIGGDGLARGYLNRAGLTAEKFIPNLFSQQRGSRLYRTGDIARYLPDGNLQFLGRVDHQVKIHGFRIEISEIEFALSQHPAVKQNSIIAREDVSGSQRLVAYVVVRPGYDLTPGELRQFLQTKLPHFMIPSAFVKLDKLPLTSNGKVDRHALPPPTHSWPDLTNPFVLPNNVVEELLAQIWGNVLGIAQVSVHDNFFELGGDSILGLRVISRAREAGIHLLPKQIFQYQTIAELAAVATIATSLVAEQKPVTGFVPLMPIQHWFFEQQFHHPHHWNQSLLLTVHQKVDPVLLERTVRTLLFHHDALRMRFEHDKSGWQQMSVAPDDQVPFTYIDLSMGPVSQYKSMIETVSAKVQTSLKLEQGPLSRFVFFNLGSGELGRLLIVVHHLVIDTISWQILLEDLQTIYQQLDGRTDVVLPLKTTSFQEWAERLYQYAHSKALMQEMAYWLENAGVKVKPLPLDFPANRNANTLASSRNVSVLLDTTETDLLLHEVPKAYRASVHEILLAALLNVLTQWTGENHLLIHLEGHGREPLFEDADISRTVGWFTALYPVLLEIGSDKSPVTALKKAKEQLRRVPNGGINYGILHYLTLDNGVYKTLPQPDIIFNYLGQFDHIDSENLLFTLATESTGAERSQRGKRTHLLTINAYINLKHLHVSWAYSENLYRPATIEKLAHSHLENLRWFVAHRESPETHTYIASDFPRANLNQSELEKFLSDLQID